MNEKRFVAFDYLRVIAISGIVLCHCSYGWKGLGWIGNYLGSTFNVVFLGISALLLGLSWEKGGYTKYSFIPYVQHRWGKLIASYYPFLTFMFGLMYVMSKPISLKNIITHITFLSWFDKIPGFGHLWFLTMISACYIVFYIVSRFYGSCQKNRTPIFIAISIVGIIGQYFVDKIHLPGSIFLYILITMGLFIYSKPLLIRIKQLNIYYFLPVYAFINILSLVAFYRGIFDIKFYSNWLGVLSGLSQIILILYFFKEAKRNKYIEYISVISFEIYLLHHFLCFGEYSIYHLTNSYVIGFVLIISISLIGATLLHKFANVLNKYLSKSKPL